MFIFFSPRRKSFSFFHPRCFSNSSLIDIEFSLYGSGDIALKRGIANDNRQLNKMEHRGMLGWGVPQRDDRNRLHHVRDHPHLQGRPEGGEGSEDHRQPQLRLPLAAQGVRIFHPHCALLNIRSDHSFPRIELCIVANSVPGSKLYRLYTK
ncbi:hypothetical protein CEXT_592281 [Caerostris extrusa]|uniref:Uncharacterized protein n=1 Tax=Caerostris extrusa TaxID=172846 RepID=A0AAV4VRR5_CAEEX|nr:hypothetical protein CEXT_592281 [Caerostris extrusa]